MCLRKNPHYIWCLHGPPATSEIEHPVVYFAVFILHFHVVLAALFSVPEHLEMEMGECTTFGQEITKVFTNFREVDIHLSKPAQDFEDTTGGLTFGREQ